MMNQDKAKAAAEVLVKEIKTTALELVTLEDRRAFFLSKFLEETDLEKDLEHYRQFKELTHKSHSSLEKFLDYYAQALGYILLFEKEGHLSKPFKDIYQRFQTMEELAKRINSTRKKEIKMLEKILGRKSIFAKVFDFDKLRNSSERIFRGYIRRETLLLLALVRNALENKEEIEKINQLLKTEKKKERVYLAISGATWAIPMIGTLMFLISNSFLTWLNSYSQNYQELEKLLK